jgi:DnaJ-class molecular chaperone
MKNLLIIVAVLALSPVFAQSLTTKKAEPTSRVVVDPKTGRREVRETMNCPVCQGKGKTKQAGKSTAYICKKCSGSGKIEYTTSSKPAEKNTSGTTTAK